MPSIPRRTFLQSGAAAALASPLLAALRQDRLDAAADVLVNSVATGQVESAVLRVAQGDATFTRHFGRAASGDAMFLLGSISKPISVTALMTLFDRKEFRLDDPLRKFLPTFTGGGRDRVTMQHLLTHTSGLPDQLAENNTLRAKHADLAEFIDHATRAPVQFAPGSKYQYSSMGILLAMGAARQMSGTPIPEFIERSVFEPLGMKHSAQGLGRFAIGNMVRVQTEHAAPESGGGDPAARKWDWNSPYWRNLGAPWGGTHSSAADIARFLSEFLFARGQVVKPETAKRMSANQNPAGVTPRGLGFNVGAVAGSEGCSERTFGHTGSTGTLAWADPATETICVVLTSLPGAAVKPHARDLAGTEVAAAAR